MRRAVNPQARGRARTQTLPAPVKGLVLNQPTAVPDPAACEVIENWIPTLRGVRVRGGRSEVADCTNAVTSFITYNHPTLSAIFAATSDSILDISALDGVTAPTTIISQQTSGYYSTQQIGTAGGDYLYAVNGTDAALLFDGSDWNPVNASAVREIAYDALSADFTVGETLTGGTSGATATILAVIPSSATEGVLKIGPVTSGPFQDNEALTDSDTGSATANGADAAASSTTITGVDTDTLSAVWLYRNRLFFIQKNTLKAWYLGVDSIGGAASDVSLAGIFQRGGSLLFGATWSMDSGDGMDDRCVFVSTEGEVAIYEGNDPSDANAWGLVGRYDVAKPLGVNGWMQAGGDLLIATVDGIVPLSQAINKDPAALSLSAVSRPIESLWQFEARQATSPVELIKWASNGIGMVVMPEADFMPVVNLQSGAWAKQTGWAGNCATVFNEKGYIGLSTGKVCEIDVTGKDEDDPFVAQLCYSFQEGSAPGVYKRSQMVRPVFFAPERFTYRVSMAVDYTPSFPPAPGDADISESTEFLVWDVGNWDEKLWWSDAVEEQTQGITEKWRTVTGSGFAIAPQLQITSGQNTKLNIELIRMDMTYEEGGVVV